MITTLSLLLAFFVGWPWFVVDGDHPIRDSFAFAGVGIGLWLIVLLLVMQESFPRGQPSQIRLRGELEYREFRNRWQSRPHTDIVTATIEPDIIYVKGIPGRRTPLVIRFIDGSQLTVDDMRAKHLRSTTHAIARAIADWRRECPIDPEAVTRVRAAVDEHRGETDEARATVLSELVGIDPEAGRHRRLFELGELLRSREEHDRAIACYQAHLDGEPHDAPAFEALASSYLAIGRRDLAADATAVAERILLNG